MAYRRVLIVGTATVCGLVLLAGATHATPAQGDSVRTELASGTTDQPISIVTHGEPTALSVQHLTLRPGASSGWHIHPGPEYSVITVGSLTVQTAEDCLMTDFSAGQAVFIPAGLPHYVANETADDAEAVVTYTLPAGSAPRGDAPDACE
jgi:quercetin dioxygenase-like cupin family protein